MGMKKYSRNQNIYFVSLKKIRGKVYSWVISQNVQKGTPVTDWLNEWQTENASNVNIFSKETFFVLYKESSIIFISSYIRQENSD